MKIEVFFCQIASCSSTAIMKTLGWPPNFVARCPVRLFEAAAGGGSWLSSGTLGEFHMKPLGNEVLHFQMHDLLDNQILFEHTMHKADAFIVSTNRFFVIRLENGSFRGFGFADEGAAHEMKERVQKAVKPFLIQEMIGQPVSNVVAANNSQDLVSCVPKFTASLSSKKTCDLSYESVPRRLISNSSSYFHSKEQMPSVPSMATSSSTSSLKRLVTLPRLKLGVVSHIFGWREQEIEIGYPTDVKHVAHIGWDGPSVSGPSWINEIKPAPDFSSGPLREFGQPSGPDWIHDASSAAKWGSHEGLTENICMPPPPPKEFKDDECGQRRRKTMDPASRKQKTDASRFQVYRT